MPTFDSFFNDRVEQTSIASSDYVMVKNGSESKKINFLNLEKTSNSGKKIYTGGITKPIITVNSTDNTKIDYTGATAIVAYNDGGVFRLEDDWTLDPATAVTPIWSNASAQNTWFAVVPDFTTKNTTRKLKVVFKTGYKNFKNDLYEASQVCSYAPITRNEVTGQITITSINYRCDPYSSSLQTKVSTLISGSEYVAGYDLLPEASNFGGVVGSYLAISQGSALTAGRNDSNDPFSTYFVNGDTAQQGAISTQSRAYGGAGNVGQEGQLLDRQNGVNAKAPAPYFEPTPAQTFANLTAAGSNRWVAYRVVIFPGSKIQVFQPSIVDYTSQANAINATHQYDTTYKFWDRYIPTMHRGYFVVRQGFNPSASWASNSGLWALYDTNKNLIAS
jgi:hypothetical protein